MTSSDELTKRMLELKERMLNVAMRDGQISIDEQAILDVVNKGLDKVVDQLYNNKAISDDEFKKLRSIIEKLEDDSVSIAKVDDLISDDEIALLGLLFKEIDQLF